jgi:predicted nucleic acid-binding protein
MIEILNRRPKAEAWIAANPGLRAALPSLVVMELYLGCRSKQELAATRKVIDPFARAHIREEDSVLGLELYRTHCLSSGISIPDAIIAAMAINRKATLRTFNAKHFSVIKGLIVAEPYAR